MILSLTDRQLRAIQNAAGRLPLSERDGFLRAVAARLGAEPSDDAVNQAIDLQLRIGRLPNFQRS